MDGIETYLAGSPLIAMGAVFVAGILAGLSPCVYPMVPIVSAYVASRASGDGSRLRSFLLSLCYVLGMAGVYALLGMIAALSGSLFGRISTSPWALLAVANVLILFALNTLEVIPFPTWLSGRHKEPAAGGMPGAFLIGAASGLVASPCTSPVLFALLTFVATGSTILYGALLLFSFSLGMGLPLLVVGTGSGLVAALPKPGNWMLVAKKVLGLLMLLLAEYYLVLAGQRWF